MTEEKNEFLLLDELIEDNPELFGQIKGHLEKAAILVLELNKKAPEGLQPLTLKSNFVMVFNRKMGVGGLPLSSSILEKKPQKI